MGNGEWLKKGKRRAALAAACGFFCAAACGAVLYLSVSAYRGYKEELILMEEEQLLTMARTVGHSLVNDIGQELKGMDLYFSSMELNGREMGPGDIQRAAAYYLKQNRQMYDGAVCYDGEGREVFRLGACGADHAMVQKRREAYICGKRLCEGGWYELFISRKVAAGEQEDYTVVYAMNLDQLYSRIVKPVKIGEGGYSIVKDSDLTILMHHAGGQVGMDAIEGRRAAYPWLDLDSLEQWIMLQETQDEAYSLIDSYTWGSREPKPVRRLVAYTTICFQDERWIVNSTLPFEELEGPLSRMIGRLAGMSGVFLIILAAIVSAMTRGLVRLEGQKKELSYLREINRGMELLRHKEEEIRHYQRVQSLGQMSSHIAHEFNNYLTPVIVYGELLERDEGLSKEQRQMAGELLRSAEQAAQLSRRLLDFSRQDLGGALSVLDLSGEVRRALGVIRQLCPKDIALREEVDEREAWARGREGMMQHILMNLCNNAFNAMEDKGGTLTVRFGACQEGGRLRLEVEDTGCGISPESAEKIFEPFYTTKRSGKGTGLGLSVVRNIVEGLGGSIELESRMGEGTVFRLYFPPAEPGEEAAGAAVRRIVVVDDDPQVLRALKDMLSGWDYEVECCSHPAAVLSRIKRQKDYCGLVLTDYSMPAMDGLELAGVIRRLNPKIRIILMSGAGDGRFEWYLKNRVVDGFVLKTELYERLEKLLGRTRAEDGGPKPED